MRVVADLSAALLAVQRFDGGVDIRDPWSAQFNLHVAHEFSCKPVLVLLGTNALNAMQHVFFMMIF